MADKKISQLTTLAQADIAVTADFLPIVDTSATETKKATPEAVVLRALGATTASVGIGTASPSVRLEVEGGAAANIVAIRASAEAGSALLYTVNANASATQWYVGHNASDVDMGNLRAGALKFFTNSAERMRITSAGNIVAGASAALATTATNGFLYVPTCAGTPTGTPTAITGMAPIVVDTTNNKLYFYSGGAWRDAGP